MCWANYWCLFSYSFFHLPSILSSYLVYSMSITSSSCPQGLRRQRLMFLSCFGRQDIVLESWKFCYRSNHGIFITWVVHQNTMTWWIFFSMTLRCFMDHNTGWDSSLADFNFSCQQILVAKTLKRISQLLILEMTLPNLRL